MIIFSVNMIRELYLGKITIINYKVRVQNLSKSARMFVSKIHRINSVKLQLLVQ